MASCARLHLLETLLLGLSPRRYLHISSMSHAHQMGLDYVRRRYHREITTLYNHSIPLFHTNTFRSNADGNSIIIHHVKTTNERLPLSKRFDPHIPLHSCQCNTCENETGQGRYIDIRSMSARPLGKTCYDCVVGI